VHIDESYIQHFGGKTCGKEPLARPRCRWGNDIKMYHQDVRWGHEWFHLAYDRARWKAFVNAVINFRSSIKCGNFLD